MQNVFKMFEPCVSVLLARLGGHSVRVCGDCLGVLLVGS